MDPLLILDGPKVDPRWVGVQLFLDGRIPDGSWIDGFPNGFWIPGGSQMDPRWMAPRCIVDGWLPSEPYADGIPMYSIKMVGNGWIRG